MIRMSKSVSDTFTEKPNSHVWHNCHQGQDGVPWCSGPPLPSRQCLLWPSCLCCYPALASSLLHLLVPFCPIFRLSVKQSRGGTAATPSAPQGPASSTLHGAWSVPQERARGSSCTLQQHSHCTQCLCAALAGNCQQHIGYPHKAGRVPSLVLFRCLLGGLLSKMALTSDPAADGVTVALADCHSHPVSSLTFSFLYNVGNPAPGF